MNFLLPIKRKNGKIKNFIQLITSNNNRNLKIYKYNKEYK